MATNNSPEKILLAIVGMPGAGKSEAVSYIKSKNIPYIRFGDLTDEKLKEQGLELTPENERVYREKIREELGMAAYAITAKPKIDEALEKEDALTIDGVYSWEEYKFLKKEYPNLKVVYIFAEPELRHKRLAIRPVRPLTKEQAIKRDYDEIEKLNKGGTIAAADYLIENDSDQMQDLYKKIDALLKRLGVTK
jgi:dephospho-CoA kinase